MIRLLSFFQYGYIRELPVNTQCICDNCLELVKLSKTTEQRKQVCLAIRLTSQIHWFTVRSKCASAVYESFRNEAVITVIVTDDQNK